jgi:hypothetical protein
MLASPIIVATVQMGVSGMACPGCTVEIFSDEENEGRVYEGSAIADDSGYWMWTGTLTGPYVTATATDEVGNTSAFSLPHTANRNLDDLPQIMKEEEGEAHLLPPSLEPDNESELYEESTPGYVQLAGSLLIIFIILVFVFSVLIVSRREKK